LAERRGVKMRRIEKGELRALAEFFSEQFYDDIQFRVMTKGIEGGRAKQLINELFYSQLYYLFKQNDVFVEGSTVTGGMIGADKNKRRAFGYLRTMVYFFKKTFQILSKEERKQFFQNSKTIFEVSSLTWHKKYCKEAPYELAVLAVGKDFRGTGLCRKIMEHLFDFARATHKEIFLITYTRENVSIYEHFGFELMETRDVKDGAITEYRMLKCL
jgi:N-acetylglutamate synthase-like GNAT family acetyltransferase